jgi:putative ubiquitin-RnfH superfamily antitoxin RatB of RatAB toxin-antitoxin module
MEKDCYQEIIDEVSKKLSDKIISAENKLPVRSILIDSDILEIVRNIRLQTTRNILESTRDELAQKMKEKDRLAIHRNPIV